ncbi:MAG: SPOR domain-containing protein [Terriglobales bacterium]|jgi:cell division septation protein DedD
MPTAQQDTEITLGTGRMLAIFFSFVLVCAFFFSIGFSLGRRTAIAGAGSSLSAPTATPATIVRPSAAKNDATQATPPSSSSSNDFSFYKAVGEKNANAALTPPDSKAQPAASIAATATAEAPSTAATDAATAAPAGGGYYVQVAAVSRQEDAESLVEALKKKQYPAFTANNPSADKFYHVQVGPYADLKDAEAMRARLISDGYNPIVKK